MMEAQGYTLPAPVAAFHRAAADHGLTLLETEVDAEEGRREGPRSWRLFRADDPLCGLRTELFLYWTPPRDGRRGGGILNVYRYSPLAGRSGVRSRKTLVKVPHRHAFSIIASLTPPALLSQRTR